MGIIFELQLRRGISDLDNELLYQLSQFEHMPMDVLTPREELTVWT
jgi:hypothetical protein